jgi:hypothetical protein
MISASVIICTHKLRPHYPSPRAGRPAQPDASIGTMGAPAYRQCVDGAIDIEPEGHFLAPARSPSSRREAGPRVGAIARHARSNL